MDAQRDIVRGGITINATFNNVTTTKAKAKAKASPPPEPSVAGTALDTVHYHYHSLVPSILARRVLEFRQDERRQALLKQRRAAARGVAEAAAAASDQRGNTFRNSVSWGAGGHGDNRSSSSSSSSSRSSSGGDRRRSCRGSDRGSIGNASSGGRGGRRSSSHNSVSSIGSTTCISIGKERNRGRGERKGDRDQISDQIGAGKDGLIQMMRTAGQLRVSPLLSPPPALARDKLPWPWGEGLLPRVRADPSTTKGKGIMERTGPINVSQRGGKSGGRRAGAALWARVLTGCPIDRRRVSQYSAICI